MISEISFKPARFFKHPQIAMYYPMLRDAGFIPKREPSSEFFNRHESGQHNNAISAAA